ncbi:DegT/DnrJ/EryC1/StrS family aminotransferase [Streptomyces sp. NPDC014748]|jgi:dTDP-4-amino-4,6-dideoxygalactose transaminase|uniref:DegT/DnrJ/EryC1/StrS family aminotransferase n=1 Tax=unclassified Streptomyces TaxID=2593676 RepID=UPI0013B8C716|nr:MULTISPECIES: DegT/DnrJ/EryC1/StrS family aminotransferase [unclassified Streptomyces]MYX42014.1 aminotransferase class I/II-fold pyridoxal phosphate-dependent enzyme [Streptomyces sp. SID89]NED31314.1 DegT/DnrJ/EryC1/StrS family aminotransferase [Streptomyces sp. SID8499]NED76412.1 DegT/DnrJ/EryC1/StrS family aminotransferase [Streptomyces sp. SID9944]NMO37017.1 DegT/DnrJ/EryC1/StrS family aminotransferase [Streptomyces sp. GMY02]
MKAQLAMFGSKPVVRPEHRRLEWPVVTQADKDAVLRALDSRKFTVGAKNEQEISGLEREWAEFCDTRYAVAVNSGTVALELALTALGLQPGDEVIVPALSYVATAMAPLYQLAIPVFVDIDPVTFNIDVTQIEAKITSRTRAIVPVHLGGLPADMDEIRALARKYDLLVVEDAVQAQGGKYRGETAGSMGAASVFSLNVEKSVPTCGEGGLIVTDDESVAERCRSLRILGEDLSTEERLYVSATRGSNLKLSSVLAAFTRSQLARFWEYQDRRDKNIPIFLSRLAALPGIVVPPVPEDRTHMWHMLRFRFDPQAAGLDGVTPGRFRQALRRALLAEGVPLTHYQIIPLPGQPVFQEQNAYGNGYPWSLPGTNPQRYDLADYPVTCQVIEDSLCLRRMHLNPDAGPALDEYAAAFERVWENLDVIARFARALDYAPPWAAVKGYEQKAGVPA